MTIGGKRFYARSDWEVLYGCYLEGLKQDKQISDWEHEPETFWFEGIRRGVTNYKPDFLLIAPDGAKEYHEVKGWMDAQSKTKIKRMAKYHPDVKLVVRDAAWFRRHKTGLQFLRWLAKKDGVACE